MIGRLVNNEWEGTREGAVSTCRKRWEERWPDILWNYKPTGEKNKELLKPSKSGKRIFRSPQALILLLNELKKKRTMNCCKSHSLASI
jgi:hypothetical protein